MVVETLYEQYSVNDDTSNVTADANDVFLLGQTFTVGTVGTDEAFIPLRVLGRVDKIGSPTGTAKWTIRSVDGSADPTGAIIAQASFDVSTLSATVGFQSQVFDVSGELSAATQYALVLEGGSTLNDNTNHIDWRSDASSPTYSGGQVESSTNNGVTWTGASGADFLFQIFGNVWTPTLCEYQDVVYKVGSKVATSLTVGERFELLNQAALQAQSFVNVVTRREWVALYSTLTSEVRNILNDIVSSHAAITAIAFDMSGYTTRVEAETMINVHRDSVLRNMSILRNKEAQTFMVNDS